jgi:hypothetical protein
MHDYGAVARIIANASDFGVCNWVIPSRQRPHYEELVHAGKGYIQCAYERVAHWKLPGSEGEGMGGHASLARWLTCNTL